MTNRIDKLFSEKKKNILSIYFTAGFPHLKDTPAILSALQKYGADLVEVGMPYSDPLADGPIIQHSSSVALLNGISIKTLFGQLKYCRQTVHLPLILMGYLNPVMQYGIEKFCMDAHNTGIDGIILPDLPLPEYEAEHRQLFQKYNLHFIFLITPETGEDRIRKIDDASNVFIYAVSSSSTTGTAKNFERQERYFERLEKMKLKNKVLVGFGIKDHKTFSQACKHAAGAIIGTEFIRAIENSGNIDADTKRFLNSILHPQTIS